MKMLLILLFGLVLCVGVVSASSLNDFSGNFSDGFESGNFSSAWIRSVTGTGANNWTVSSVSPASGLYVAQDIGQSASQSGVLTLNLSTVEYGNITLKYQKRNVNFLIASSLATVEYFDGSSWNTLYSDSVTDASYVNMSFTLPSSASNNPNFQVKWTCLSGTIASRYCLVDNVRLTGAYGLYNSSVSVIPNVDFNYSIGNSSNGFLINISLSNDGSKINTTLVTSNKTTYSYVGRGLYEANFKSLISTTGVISITRGIELKYQPNGIYWSSSNGDTTIDANPSGTAIVNGSSIFWTDAYVSGVSIKYIYMPTELKEYLIINNRSNIGNPSVSTLAGQNISFKQQFVINNINSADLFIDDDFTSWITIGSRTAFKGVFKYNNTPVFTLHTPYAYDSVGNNVTGWYTFIRNGVSLYVEMNIPFGWINSSSRVYPIYIDPTTSIDVNGNLIINLSDESFNPLEQITLNNVQGSGELFIDTQISSGVRYAINPVNLAFDSGHVDVKNATKGKLLKCPSWNYVNEVCVDGWIGAGSMSVGSLYDVNFTSIDPAYSEVDSDFDLSTLNYIESDSNSSITFSTKILRSYNDVFTFSNLVAFALNDVSCSMVLNNSDTGIIFASVPLSYNSFTERYEYSLVITPELYFSLTNVSMPSVSNFVDNIVCTNGGLGSTTRTDQINVKVLI